MPWKALATAVVSVLAIAPAIGLQQSESEQSGAPLYTALLLGEDPPQSSIASVPPAAREAVAAAIARAKAYRPRIPIPPNGEWFEKTLAEQRQRLERSLVSLVPGARVQKDAAEYASQAVLAYEWEGFSDPPLGEAAHAEEFLAQHPMSVLRPAIEVFQLYRYRAAFEAAGFEGNMESRKTAAAKYVTLWEQVSRSKNVVVTAVAHEMDRATFLYIENQGHPRR